VLAGDRLAGSQRFAPDEAAMTPLGKGIGDRLDAIVICF
jgi:hypothetical protein